MKYLWLKQNQEVFKYGDEGELFYIIIKGIVGVKVPLVEDYLFTQKEFAEFYLKNKDLIIIDKTEHSINVNDMKSNDSFADFIKNKLNKG